jgi:sporadic carbohydrate cluster protein (TIGR04323 family)
MSRKYGAFALLDSSYIIPQHIQMMTFKNYVGMHDIKLEFYGGELVGTEDKHRIFLNYIETKRYSDYIFFSIRQFLDSNLILQETLIKKALEKGITMHFANENRKIEEEADIMVIKGLIIGIKSRQLEEYLRNSVFNKLYRQYAK